MVLLIRYFTVIYKSTNTRYHEVHQKYIDCSRMFHRSQKLHLVPPLHKFELRLMTTSGGELEGKRM